MRKVALILAVLLLITQLSACQSAHAPLYTDELTEEIRMEIIKAWFEKDNKEPVFREDKPNEVLGCPYYGRYNGYDVFFSSGNMMSMETKMIGNEIFQYNVSFVIYVYKDGTFWFLEDAYREGLMSDEDLAKIAKKHADMYEAERANRHL